MKLLFILGLLCLSSNVFGQNIETKVGFWSQKYYQEEERIPKEKVLQLLKTNTNAYSFWETGKTYEILSYPTILLGVGFTAWNIKSISNQEYSAVPAIGGIITGVDGLIFLNKISKNRILAIQTYNQKISNETTLNPQLKDLAY